MDKCLSHRMRGLSVSWSMSIHCNYQVFNILISKISLLYWLSNRLLNWNRLEILKERTLFLQNSQKMAIGSFWLMGMKALPLYDSMTRNANNPPHHLIHCNVLLVQLVISFLKLKNHLYFKLGNAFLRLNVPFRINSATQSLISAQRTVNYPL